MYHLISFRFISSHFTPLDFLISSHLVTFHLSILFNLLSFHPFWLYIIILTCLPSNLHISPRTHSTSLFHLILAISSRLPPPLVFSSHFTATNVHLWGNNFPISNRTKNIQTRVHRIYITNTCLRNPVDVLPQQCCLFAALICSLIGEWESCFQPTKSFWKKKVLVASEQ